MSEPVNYQKWIDDFSEAEPSSVVLSSKAQNWLGLEVVQIHHNANQAIIPAFQSHLLLIHHEDHALL